MIEYPYRNVIIYVDDNDENYETLVIDAKSKEDVGRFIFRYDDDDNFLLITNMNIGENYRRQGIGRQIIYNVANQSGLAICARRHDGLVREDGSHLTENGPAFVEALVGEKLLRYLD